MWNRQSARLKLHFKKEYKYLFIGEAQYLPDCWYALISFIQMILNHLGLGWKYDSLGV